MAEKKPENPEPKRKLSELPFAELVKMASSVKLESIFELLERVDTIVPDAGEYSGKLESIKELIDSFRELLDENKNSNTE